MKLIIIIWEEQVVKFGDIQPVSVMRLLCSIVGLNLRSILLCNRGFLVIRLFVLNCRWLLLLNRWLLLNRRLLLILLGVLRRRVWGLTHLLVDLLLLPLLFAVLLLHLLLMVFLALRLMKGNGVWLLILIVLLILSILLVLGRRCVVLLLLIVLGNLVRVLRDLIVSLQKKGLNQSEKFTTAILRSDLVACNRRACLGVEATGLRQSTC